MTLAKISLHCILNDTHREKLCFTQFSTGTAAWVLLTFFLFQQHSLGVICRPINIDRRGGGEKFCKKWLSQYIFWLVVLTFQVLKSNTWRKNELHRMNVYFLEMNFYTLSHHLCKKWEIRKSIMAGVTIPFNLSSGFYLMVRYLRIVKMVCIQGS